MNLVSEVIRKSRLLKLVLVFSLHLIITVVIWSFTWTEDKQMYVLALINFLFFLITILLFHRPYSYSKPALIIAKFILIAFFVQNALSFNISFDPWLCNSYQSGLGWPFSYYCYDPFSWFNENDSIPYQRWYFDNLFYNLYFAAFGLAGFMSTLDYFLEKRIARRITK